MKVFKLDKNIFDVFYGKEWYQWMRVDMRSKRILAQSVHYEDEYKYGVLEAISNDTIYKYMKEQQ